MRFPSRTLPRFSAPIAALAVLPAMAIAQGAPAEGARATTAGGEGAVESASVDAESVAGAPTLRVTQLARPPAPPDGGAMELARWFDVTAEVGAPVAGRVLLLLGPPRTEPGAPAIAEGLAPGHRVALDPATSAVVLNTAVDPALGTTSTTFPVPTDLPLGTRLVAQALLVPEQGALPRTSRPVDLVVIDAFDFDLTEGLGGWHLEPSRAQLEQRTRGLFVPDLGLLLAPDTELALSRGLLGLEPGASVELAVALDASQLVGHGTTATLPSLRFEADQSSTALAPEVLGSGRDLRADGVLRVQADASGRLHCTLHVTAGGVPLELERVGLSIGR